MYVIQEAELNPFTLHYLSALSIDQFSVYGRTLLIGVLWTILDIRSIPKFKKE